MKTYRVNLTAVDKAVIMFVLNQFVGGYMDMPEFVDRSEFTNQMITARKHLRQAEVIDDETVSE